MNNWMEGYTSDIEYTAGYYKELDPNFLNICAVLANVEPIDLKKSFNYCELGCGQGLSSLIMAANYPQGTFYAVDYNPSHIAYARKIAKQAGLKNIHFLEKSFQDLVDIDYPNQLVDMNFIVFHGIYTWVNNKNRDNLIKLCQRNLVSGGIVYNSYNAKPGWLSGEPIQKLMFALSEESSGNSLKKINYSIDTLNVLKEIKSGYFVNYKADINKRLEQIIQHDKRYVIHEYLHKGWQAFYSHEVSEKMAEAKLDYLCSASPSEAYSSSLLPEEIKKQLILLNTENRELLKDLILNTSFRKDIYVRGSIPLDAYQQKKWFEKQDWILLKNQLDLKEYKFNLSVGEFVGNKDLYSKITSTLSKATKAISTKELEKITKENIHQIIQALIFLYSFGYIASYSDSKNIKFAQKLNRIIALNAFDESSFKYIALPKLKSAISYDITMLIWLRGLYAGHSSSQSLVNYAYQAFNKRELSLMNDNKKITGNAMKKYLYQLETKWRKEILPLWLKAGVLDLDT